MPKDQKNSKDASYKAKDIYVLEGLDPVRKRPGMYIGSTGVDGLHHLVWEVVDNAIDEAMAGYAKNIEISLLPDNKVLVRDDGRGIPVDIHPQTKKPALETVMCTLHAGGKFGGESYKVSGGLHGVGISVVNALSKWTKAEICRDGKIYTQEYSRGKPLGKMKKGGSCSTSGTTITFEPDEEVFGVKKEGDKKVYIPSLNWSKILMRLRQQAYLTKGIRITAKDLRDPANSLSHSFYFEGGLISYLKFLSKGAELIQKEPFYAYKESDGILVEVAAHYETDIENKEMTFANNIHTPEGGMHLTGFRTALTRTLNNYTRQNNLLKDSDDNLSSEDVREGLTVIVSVKLPEPQFEGQTKAKLGNPEARSAVETVVGEKLAEYLEKNPQDARKIVEKCVISQKARKAAKAARETVLRKGAMEGLTLPGKLADCSSKIAEESELYIVEGDSAGGSAKQGRNRHFQAILPLKGKILNVERARLDKMLAFQEIRALIIAMGTAIAEEFNIDKLRYHRIIIMTDADVDGSHIRTLLLTLFFRYFPALIEHGYIYIAQPPLYSVKYGKKMEYAYTEEERDIIIEKMKSAAPQKTQKGEEKIEDKEEVDEDLSSESVAAEKEGKLKGVNIQRYKGLGEMNPEQLWETTMNPENRILKKVTIDDAAEADKVFDILMGSEVLPRKKFIQTHAKETKNLDI